MKLLAFNRWGVEGINVSDKGLQRYISLEPKLVPKTGARYAGKRFHKSKTFIVERLINRLMVPGHKGKKHNKSSGHCCGTAPKTYKDVEAAFDIIEKKTGKNPIMIFVQALENAAPREEIVTIEYGGARYPKAVDCAPQRRIDIALKFFTQGTYDKCFNKKKSFPQALSEELLAAFQLDQNKSQAIKKKLEIERQADASR